MDLTPAQQRVVSDLWAWGQPRPTFDRSAADDLRRRLEEALAPAAEALPADEPLWISKSALAQVHACEAHYEAERAWDGWSVASAEGEVTHRAIRLSVAGVGANGTAAPQPPPLELVDHALDELGADNLSSLGAFVATLTPAARTELRAGAGNAVATFLECWPPLAARWWPRTELPVRADLCGGRIVLSGKVDLALGHARGAEARCLFVDLKTGGHYPFHLDDLRFYALIQTLRIGVPPFRVASYYLDSASFAAEDVTVDVLEAALLRTVHGAGKMIEVRVGQRAPSVTPCPRCRYCRLRADCDGARQWAAAQSGQRDESGDGDEPG